MTAVYSPSTLRQLEQLASDVVHLCDGKHAIVRCGDVVIAQYGSNSAEAVVAVQPFGVGNNSFELILFDDAPRDLTATQVGSFHALSAVLRRQLEVLEPSIPSEEDLWIKDHVAVALDYVTDAFVLVRTDWTIQHVNTTLERLARVPRGQVLGRLFWEVFPQVVGTPFETEARAAMGSALPRVVDLHSEQTDRWYQSRVFPCSAGLAILTTDVTERRREESARVERERRSQLSGRLESLGSLAGGIAHDFNNILGAILGHVGLLSDQVPPGYPGRESIEQIGVAGRRARDLVQQILAYARAATREVIRRPIRPMVEEAVALLRPTLPSNARLHIALSRRNMITTLEPSEVQQLVANLGTNGGHALNGAEGDVSIRLRPVRIDEQASASIGRLSAGAYVELSVSDTGTGMQHETLQHLFEPFFTTKRRGQGTGLGLHVVSGIVTAHKGAIVVQSKPGVGSIFRVYLPAADRADNVPVEIPTARARLGQMERVAYLDDDDVVRLMVQRVLEHHGYAVTAYADPARLLRSLKEQPGSVDLLVTDYSMPAMNGLEVAYAARTLRSDLPIIIATGHAPDELRAAVQALGHTDVLNKEQCFEQLGARVWQALHRAEVPTPSNGNV
ncbi:ATP-binding protein [Aquincola sp. J276]|uniref:ATP-binding protein n=1 Tax=Aquincola sp. J276 TaxID=2898432 RepID=UPI002151050A|nr:ATP-binding protein [Aquincola sp. J276]MCR5868158.1 ATP-binding protein [Aquincola sp. J276]